MTRFYGDIKEMCGMTTEKIYPEDEHMKELDDGARIWRIFNDESERIDAETVDGWTGTLDTLFIFAGLFSAVIATFLSLTAQSRSAVTASLLTEMVSLQRTTAVGGNISAIPQSYLTYSYTFTSSSRDVWLNTLWFASLVLTLSVALMAGLIKQWLHYYLADITGANPKVRALTRQFRYRGLIQWGVPPIIESLPVLMNTSLFLFFIGLNLFTRDLSGTLGISWFLGSLTIISFMFYVGSSLIPVWKPQCPYKTSLSKLYSGIFKVAWYFFKQLSFGDEEDSSTFPDTKEDTKIRFRHYFTHFRRLVSKVLSRGSSLRVAESEVVGNLGIRLTQDIITEMGINSPNSSVSAVALQSLAALHVPEMHRISLGLSDSLINKIRDGFRGCFRVDTSKTRSYSIVSDSLVAERYSRAMLLFPDRMSDLYDGWFRLFSFPPDRVATATLIASAARHTSTFTYLKFVIQCILDDASSSTTSMKVSGLFPWHHFQFTKAIEAAGPDLYSADEQKELLVMLVKSLSSPVNPLTLHEDLLIRCLFASYTRAGVTGSLKVQALNEELDLETSSDITSSLNREALLQFVMLLPDIYECTESLGSEEQDKILLYLFWMGFHSYKQTVVIDMTWDGWIFHFDFEHEYSSCVNPLIKLLNRLAASCEWWNDNLRLRLRVTAGLHRFLWQHGTSNGEVIHVMLHWLLVMLLKGQDCPANDDRIPQEDLESALFESAIPFSKDYSINITSLRQCCVFIASKQLVGLPPQIMDRLTALFMYSLEELSNEPDVLDCLDILFRHFIEQDPLYVDPVYPMAQVDQCHTLTSLINLAQSRQFHLTRTEELLSGWRVLVNNKLSGISKDCEKDSWDLQDTLWMFEVDKYTDPWDLQDVLWMFEKQIPFRGPLNLQEILWKLNRALEGSIDLHDITWLFQDAPDEPYPPDDPNPEMKEISTFKFNEELEAKPQDNSRKWCSVM